MEKINMKFKSFVLVLILLAVNLNLYSQQMKKRTSVIKRKANVIHRIDVYSPLTDKELKSSCIEKYDTISFNGLGIYDDEYFAYAFYYANKYNYHTACINFFECVYDVFWNLNGGNNFRINKKFYKPIIMNKECFDFIYNYLDYGGQNPSTSLISSYHESLSRLYKEGIYLPYDSVMSRREYLKYGICSEATLDKSEQYINECHARYEKKCHEKYDGNKDQFLLDVAKSPVSKIAAFGNVAYYEEVKSKVSYKELMLYSFIMAYNYHYKPAYKDFVNSIERFYNEIHSPIDAKSADIIKYCLNKVND